MSWRSTTPLRVRWAGDDESGHLQLLYRRGNEGVSVIWGPLTDGWEWVRVQFEGNSLTFKCIVHSEVRNLTFGQVVDKLREYGYE